MSTQGATLRRGTIELPILPVAVLVVAALAAVIGLSTIGSIDTVAPARTLVTVTDAQRLANSTAAVREQGATLPSSWASPTWHRHCTARRSGRDGIRWAVRTKRCTASTALPRKAWHRRPSGVRSW